jgi:hypothetical protein
MGVWREEARKRDQREDERMMSRKPWNLETSQRTLA